MTSYLRNSLWVAAFAVLLWPVFGSAADEAGARMALQTVSKRKVPPSLTLVDSDGKTVRLADYRGKVVLLDFWATWCGGCKKEIPWFVEFSKTYQNRGLVVIGVSLDDEGWKILRPFLAKNPIPYTIVLGDEGTAKSFEIETMPDTFLIDRSGRIAAAYRGMVDRENVAQNLEALLNGHQ